MRKNQSDTASWQPQLDQGLDGAEALQSLSINHHLIDESGVTVVFAQQVGLHPVQENCGIVLVIHEEQILGRVLRETVVGFVAGGQRGRHLMLKTSGQDEMIVRYNVVAVHHNVFFLTIDGCHLSVHHVHSRAQ